MHAGWAVAFWQPDEVPMPNDSSAAAAPGNDSAEAGTGAANAPQGGGSAILPDEELVAQLVAMGGFPENGCKRAAVAVNNSSAGLCCFHWRLSLVLFVAAKLGLSTMWICCRFVLAGGGVFIVKCVWSCFLRKQLDCQPRRQKLLLCCRSHC